VNQNSVIFAGLLIGFVVFIAGKGQLGKYLALFTSYKSQTPTATSNPGTPGNMPSPFGGSTPVPQATAPNGDTFDLPYDQMPFAPGDF
jgi:hypothetical protein